ncbi:MAG: adenosylcobalamin-dependent ribonucleoside-diphosphate reductase [Candidatus Aenigmarchaeota archaeon]|nr:adenosylcobalamin-dependent ribonucleoside-diphosphate reductase [Candidatus Aenigmarchaeota archaeon]
MIVKRIMKRDGKIAAFSKDKITDAIFKAAEQVGGRDRKLADDLTAEIERILEKRSTEQRNYIPTVEEVQDLVEKVLMEQGHAKTAKAYIIYRQERSKIRNEARRILGGRFTKMYKKLSLNALKILAARYLVQDLDGNVVESPEEMFERVARALAEVEKDYEKSDEQIKKLQKEFLSVLMNLEFLPGGRTLTNAGGPTRLVSNCIVLHPEDSMEGIFETLKNAALLQQAGSGLGFPWHLLRPAGTRTVRSRGVASGPVSFLKIYDKAFGTIKQQGRHGANMAVMSVTHPDILEFIHCKEREGDMKNFNISVSLTDDFMQRVMTNDPIPWICEWRGIETKPRRIIRDRYDIVEKITEETITARELMDEIVNASWNNGEPGIMFSDNINRTNPLPKLGRIEASNPCGEQYLHDGDVCNLGSINLDRFVKDGKIDWNRLKSVTRTAIRMLDNVIDLTDFPVEKVNKTFRANRRVGLGVMGFADMLIQLGIGYNTEDGCRTAESVMSFIQECSHEMSRELADEKDVFPNWKKSIYADQGIRIRNAAVTCIAPTGTISMVCDVSSGIEPHFALAFSKSQIIGQKSMHYINKYLLNNLQEKGLYSDNLMDEIVKKGSIQNMDLPDDVKRVFVTSLDIDPEGHIKMQAAFQRHVDNSISKTCNFPYEATKEDVRKAYVLGWQLGCKSLTVYRSGSRNIEVLHLIKKNEDKKTSDNQTIPLSKPSQMYMQQSSAPNPATTIAQSAQPIAIALPTVSVKTITICPECSTALQPKDGCKACPSCGWGACQL